MLSVVLFLVGPVKVLAENYYTHDRSGNFVAWDYSYNMLNFAEPNGIIFTNGDNDTFPLWYLQEVENIRPDVRVANLSLLNTPWYIKQLKHKEPKVPMTFTDDQIENISLMPWPKEQTFEVPVVPEEVRAAEAQQYRLAFNLDTLDIPRTMSFKVKPKKIYIGGGRYANVLRVQDVMILNILTANQFRKPLYFAVTTSTQNQLNELRKYLRMDGLLFKITTIPGWEMDPETLYKNIMNFKYRGLNDPEVYFNRNITGLLQNYRTAFFRLANYYLTARKQERFREVMAKAYEVMPPEVIPFTNAQLEQIMTGYALLAGILPPDTLRTEAFDLRKLQGIGQMAAHYEAYDLARIALETLLERIESNPTGPEVDAFLAAAISRPELYASASENLKNDLRKRILGSIRRQLLRVYKEVGDTAAAVMFLERWQEADPENEFAKKELEKLKTEQPEE
ncbi:MAG: hypothetical protein D6681_04345 [Calditrichaeota bacterium]|nr:MAG: hypothetical protein D6681_04345 [Calditrichota bacterium]